MDWAVKLRVALLALVGAVVVGVSSSQATITPAALTLSTTPPYATVVPGSPPTLYYSAHIGSVTVDVHDSTDTAPLTVDFPSVFGDDPAPATSPSHTYAWTASDSDSGTKTVTFSDAGAGSGSHAFAVVRDTLPPTGQSVALSGGPNYSTAFVPLVLNAGTDAGSGIDGASGLVERASAPLTGGTCGSFGAFGPVTLTSGGDATVTSGNCYRYQYKISDLVGNQSAASAPSATAVVNSVGPTVLDTAPTEVSGAGDQFWNSVSDTLFYRPTATGSFSLNATASSTTGSISQVAFPDLSATTGWTGTGGPDSASPYASPVYTWASGATAPGAQKVVATDSTSLTGFDTITISSDSTAPAGQSVALSGGPWFGGSVALTVVAGTDAGSGVDASRSVVERAGATLTNGTCGTFGAFAPVTLSSGADTSVASGNCYRYQTKATDNVGNVSTASTPSADAKIDKTGPTTPALLFTGFANTAAAGHVVYFRPGANGSFTVTAAASDPESGIASYSFPTVAGFTAAGSGPRRTYVSTKAGTSGTGALAVSATNAAGVTSGTTSFSLVPDATAPILTVRCNGAACKRLPYAKTVMVTFSGSDVGSGLSTIRWTTDGTEPKADHGNEYTRPILLASLTHLKVRAFDKAGNPSTLVDLTVNSLAGRLLVGAPASVVVAKKGGYVRVKLSSTRRALVSATMTGTGLKKPLRWNFVLPKGTSLVQLRLPKTLRRPGAYRVVWKLSANTRRAQKTTRVTLRA
jgi:hypothetical protein